ncbi:hypothetical protein ACOI1C_22045 [Bacillus sp. DJP31]
MKKIKLIVMTAILLLMLGSLHNENRAGEEDPPGPTKFNTTNFN